MKISIGGVSLLLDENSNSDGHHKFEFASDDLYFNMIVQEDDKLFVFLLDKYKYGEEFEFSELDALVGKGDQ
jgi:hypothetical protein